MPEATTPVTPPRLPSVHLPGWARYGVALFVMSALTGIGGWMAHRGVRLYATLVTLCGVLMAIGAGGLAWRRQVWWGRVRRGPLVPLAATSLIKQDQRRAGQIIFALLGTGVALFVAGLGLIRRPRVW